MLIRTHEAYLWKIKQWFCLKLKMHAYFPHSIVYIYQYLLPSFSYPYSPCPAFFFLIKKRDYFLLLCAPFLHVLSIPMYFVHTFLFPFVVLLLVMNHAQVLPSNQSNNLYVFPGLALGAKLCQATLVMR